MDGWQLTQNPHGVITNNGLTFYKTAGGAAWNCHVRGNASFDSGVHEWKVSGVGVHVMIGVAPVGANPTGSNISTCGWYYYPAVPAAGGAALYSQAWAGQAAKSGAAFPGYGGAAIGSEYMVRLDCDNHTLTFGANGVWWPTAYSQLPAVPLSPCFEVHTGAFTVTHTVPPMEGDVLHAEEVYRNEIVNWQVAPPAVRLRLHLSTAKILILGDPGEGKSSYWNTLATGLRNRPYHPVDPSPQAEHGTRHLVRVPLYGPDNHEINALGLDCWGWVPQYPVQIPLILAGRIRENDSWDLVPNINAGPARLFNEEIHGVFLMISYNRRGDVEHARQIIDLCRPSKVPVQVLLTRCDLADDVKPDLSNFFDSGRLQTEQGKLAHSLGIDSINIHLVTSMNRQPPSPALSEAVKSRARSICMKAFLACLYSVSDFAEKVDRVPGIRSNLQPKTESS